MKSQKGVTLVSLTIYVIAMVVVVAVVAVISTYFYKNMSNIGEDIDPIVEYTKFNSFFSDEANHNDIRVIQWEIKPSGDSYIVFSNYVRYEYVRENEAIYRNNAKICRGVQRCNFLVDIKNGKPVIEVDFKAGNKTRNTTYTLKN